jgi:uncharacterized protein (TIGR03790 family)
MIVAFLIVILSSVVCNGLEPPEILVLANKNYQGSVELAHYFMEKRNIPAANLLQLNTTERESIARMDFEREVLTPLKKTLEQKERKRSIRCLTVMYGLPLRVEPPAPNEETAFRRTRLADKKRLLKEEMRSHEGQDEEARRSIESELTKVESELEELNPSDQRASLDSEIALALMDAYPLSKWVPNPFYLGHQGKFVLGMPEKGEVLMVSRLDGPDVKMVRRMIDDSVRVEEEGLRGVAYFDARWPKPPDEKKAETGYALYDRSIHLAAEAVRKSGRMPVVLNDKEELFQPGECPDAALYCGWYSLAKYVPAFSWRPGSVGFHIASSECVTLKQPGSQVWCKRMLEEGVAATLGPVAEPYVQAFPIPEIFFSLLLEGYWTLAECYALSQPFWSWQMVLLGDPLYRPFAKNRNTVDRSRKTE